MRNDSISIAKAIAIILMVLAHSGFSEYGDIFINMFHMPVFFFCSGYCFKDTNLENFNKFLKKKIKGIYLPYVKYSILFLLLHNLFTEIGLYDSYYSAHQFFLNLFHIFVSMACHDQLLGGFWFLHYLFYVSLLGYLIIKVYKRFGLIWGVFSLLTLLMISAVFIKCGFHIHVIDLHGSTLYATIFFISGYVFKQNHFKLPPPNLYNMSVNGNFRKQILSKLHSFNHC